MTRTVLFGLAGFGLLILASCDEPDCPDCNDPQVQALAVDINELPHGTQTSVVLDLPAELRTQNWGGGSCVHASTVTLLQWQGMPELAEWWRHNYSGGESSSGITSKMEKAGLSYAYTKSGDESFLEWSCRTRRCAGIFYKPGHAVNLVGLDDENAYLLDNNHTSQIETVPRGEFMRRWKNNYGGFAWTIVATPSPPSPWF